jgi:hypothetical protein
VSKLFPGNVSDDPSVSVFLNLLLQFIVVILSGDRQYDELKRTLRVDWILCLELQFSGYSFGFSIIRKPPLTVAIGEKAKRSSSSAATFTGCE